MAATNNVSRKDAKAQRDFLVRENGHEFFRESPPFCGQKVWYGISSVRLRIE
jgi:hypothetical protein